MLDFLQSAGHFRFGYGFAKPIIAFHYATEGCNLKHVAATNGFDMRVVSMHEILDDADPLSVEYEAGSVDVVRKWVPPSLDGWDLSAKHDSEDGPIAVYLRPRSK